MEQLEAQKYQVKKKKKKWLRYFVNDRRRADALFSPLAG